MLALLVATIISMVMTSCKESIHFKNADERKSPLDQLLDGRHKLYRLYSTNQMRCTSNVNEDRLYAKFAMQLSDSTYAVCEIPVTKIRVKLDSTAVEPYVTFQWNKHCLCSGVTLNEAIQERVTVMTIVCSQKDFQFDVDLGGL